MFTKIITVSAVPPAVSTGADINKGSALNATEFDQNLINLRAAIDAKAPLAGPGSGQAFAVGALSATSSIIGSGGTTSPAQSILNGGSSTGYGPNQTMRVNGSLVNQTGTKSGVFGVASDDLTIWVNTGLGIGLYAGGRSATPDIGIASTGAVTIPGAVSTGALTVTGSGSYTAPIYLDGGYGVAIGATGTGHGKSLQFFGDNGSASFEAGRVDFAGNFLLGVTSGNMHTISKTVSDDYALTVQNLSATLADGLQIKLPNYVGVGTGVSNAIAVNDSGGGKFVVRTNGNVANTNNSYGALSDIKVKENVSKARGYLGDLCRVNIVKYSLIAEKSDRATHLGVIAQELDQIFPGMVEETRDYAERPSGRFEQKEIVPAVMDGDKMVAPPIYADDKSKPIMERYATGETTKSVKYSIFTPMLITAVQELAEQNKGLEARLTALEAK